MANNHINPTDAKDIALHFYDKKGWRVDANMGRTVNTVKSLLKYGYTKDEIISVVDYVMDKTKKDIRSFGYFNYVMNEVLDKIKQSDAKQSNLKQPLPPVKEMSSESTKHNKQKLSSRNSKSNVGKKYNFDMFEE